MMSRILRTIKLAVPALVCLCASVLPAQTFPTPKYWGQVFSPQRQPMTVPDPEQIDVYVVDGKLTLSLQDSIRLTLLNNTEIKINRSQYEQAAYAALRAYSPFDPVLTASFRPVRSTQPTTSTLQGATTLSDLSQPFSANYNQTFYPGTNLQVRFNTVRSTTNSTFATFNPSFSSGTTFQLSQPLLRGRGWTVNRAPIVVAKRNIDQSRAAFEAQINDSILTVINQYWALVEAQKRLAVFRDSLKLAEESYKRDKRALELGALSPLEIYRSEGTVAQRRVQVIQAEYALKPLEDQLRRTIGADLNDRVAALDIVLTENAEIAGELPVPDMTAAIESAMKKRPELEAIRLQLANDDTNAQVARNNLKPDLSLSSFFTSNGRGGNQLTGTGVVPGGFSDSLDQVGSFNFPTYGLSLDLRLPIRNRAAQADLGTSMVSKRNSLYRLRQSQQLVNQDVRNAVHAVEESRLVIAAADNARELARKTLASEQRKYELGAQTIFFVLDAQNQYQQAEQNYLQALVGYQRSLAQLDRATGNLLEKNRVLVDSAVK
ncbi:MAG TPA: TolC family protein [Terriglobales bacterium]|nr:TolC family protein [Terriglobales bacterium]